MLNLEDTPETCAFAIERRRGVIFASAVFLHSSALTPKRLAKFGREKIIFVSGGHHVSSEWRQIQIQPGTQAEDRSAQAHPRTAGECA
jgi:hypothetical protein